MIPEILAVCCCLIVTGWSFLGFVRSSEPELELELELELDYENICPICLEDTPEKERVRPCHQKLHWVCRKCHAMHLKEGGKRCSTCRNYFVGIGSKETDNKNICPEGDGNDCVEDGDTGYCHNCYRAIT